MRHFYNEIDPGAAAWLRELMVAGAIPQGVVDERSIEDLTPADLAGHDRVSLFAGIGVWEYALGIAGWSADRPVWTASCPCQPFSSAGKGNAFQDDRHLWPAAFHLIRECGPLEVLGEQVASPGGYAWFDLVCADLEGLGYTVGACVTPAAGFGAPHGRHRIYWYATLRGVGLADSGGIGRDWFTNGVGDRRDATERGEAGDHSGNDCADDPVVVAGTCELVNPVSDGSGGSGLGEASAASSGVQRADRKRKRVRFDFGPASFAPLSTLLEQGRIDAAGIRALEIAEQAREYCAAMQLDLARTGCTLLNGAGTVGHTDGPRPQQGTGTATGNGHGSSTIADGGTGEITLVNATVAGRKTVQQPGQRSGTESAGGSGAVNGFWANAIWLPCTDGKKRPVEPGLEPLADGTASDLGLVRLASYPDCPAEERVIYAPLIQKGKARKMRIKGYGNAIVSAQAAGFVRAVLDASPHPTTGK